MSLYEAFPPRRPLLLVLVPWLLAVLLASAPWRTARGAESAAPDECVTFMKLHGDYLAQDRTGLADQADDQARAAGCYNRRGDQQLCALFAQQESQFNLSGRSDLVNIIRAQEREFQCIS